MAESDPSTQSGSDIDLTDGGGAGSDGSPRKGSAKGGKKLGSVRALAIKKVSEPHPPPLARGTNLLQHWSPLRKMTTY